MPPKFHRFGQQKPEPAQPADRRAVAHVDKVLECGIPLQQLISPLDRAAQERDIVLLDRIGAQQPRRANAGKNVEIADTEHDGRNTVDQRSAGKAGLGERVFKRLERRFA